MDPNQPDEILGLPRRPRLGDAGGNALLGGLLGAAISGNWAGAILGAAGGGALANQRQNLETAVRDYFAKHNLQVMFFHRAPRSLKVTFRTDDNSYWTVESVMPDYLQLPPEDTEDWLYGNLVKNQLSEKIRQIKGYYR